MPHDTTVTKRELLYQKRQAKEYGEHKRAPREIAPHARFFNSKSRELSITKKLLLLTLLLSSPCNR